MGITAKHPASTKVANQKERHTDKKTQISEDANRKAQECQKCGARNELVKASLVVKE